MNKKFNKLRLLYSLLIFSLVLITAYLIDLKQENKQKNAEIKLINVNVEPSNDTIVLIKNSGLSFNILTSVIDKRLFYGEFYK